MEHAVTQTQDIRRHPSGSIDFDSFRQSAMAVRRQAIRDARTLRMAPAGTLVIAGALGFVFTVGSLHTVGDQMAAASSHASQTR
jgi:hypothetical protein